MIVSKTIKELSRRVDLLELDNRRSIRLIQENRLNLSDFKCELSDNKDKLIWNIFKISMLLLLLGTSFCLGGI